MNRTVAIILVALVIGVGVLAYLHAQDADDRLRAQRDAILFITVDGEQIAEVDFDAIETLPFIEFEETLRTSAGVNRDHTYGGVQLRDLLEHYDLELDAYNQVIALSADGYAVALSIDEVVQSDNVYLAYMVDGEPMADRLSGGPGPYQLVVRADEFGQRWNKYLMEIKVE